MAWSTRNTGISPRARWALALLALWLGTGSLARADHFAQHKSTIRELAHPCDVEVDERGRIFVVESDAHRVRALSEEGRTLMTLGGKGTGPGLMRLPAGVALGPEGEIYVADAGNHRIQVFAADGTFARAFGELGPGPGQFHSPRGLVVGKDLVFVADSGNDRVQVFGTDGKFVRSIGRHGQARGELRRPSGVALDRRGHVYVTDTWNHRVQKFAATGELLDSFGSRGPHPGLFNAPTGIDYYDGTLFVTDRRNHRVQVLDLEGTVLYLWGEPSQMPRQEVALFAPRAVAVHPGGAWTAVCEDMEDRIQLFEPTEGKSEHDHSLAASLEGTRSRFGPLSGCGEVLLGLIETDTSTLWVYDISRVEPIPITSLGQVGTARFRLDRPVDTAVDRTREPWIYVSDPGQRRLSGYAIDRIEGSPYEYRAGMGRAVRSLEFAALESDERVAALELPWPLEPGPIAADHVGGLAVCDPRNGAVLVYDRELAVEAAWRPSGDVALAEPVDLAIAPDGSRILIADAAAGCVQEFARDGSHVATHATLELAVPTGVALDSHGRIFVSDRARHCIVVIAPDGEHETWGGPGEGALEFFKPAGLNIGPEGRLLALDEGNRRGQLISSEGRFIILY